MEEKQKEILSLLEEKNINKSKLAEKLGMHRSTLNNQLLYAKKLDHDLYVRIKYLVLGETEPANEEPLKVHDLTSGYKISELKKDKLIGVLLDRIENLEYKLEKCNCHD